MSATEHERIEMRRALLALLIASLPLFAATPKIDAKTCGFKGKKLYGRIQYVTSFPDIKIKVVESFPDIKVKLVTSFPDSCGKWQIVDSFPDLKVQVVDSFPDITVKFVESFPGVK
jgi:hypothetical protein